MRLGSQFLKLWFYSLLKVHRVVKFIVMRNLKIIQVDQYEFNILISNSIDISKIPVSEYPNI